MKKTKTIRVLFIEFLEIAAANHLLMMMKGLNDTETCELVLLSQKNSYLSQEIKKLRIPVYEVNYIELNLHQPKTFIPFLSTLFLVIKIIKYHKIDILHSHRLNWAYIGILAAKLTGIHLIVHIVIIEKLASSFQNFLLNAFQGIYFLTSSKNAQVQFKALYQLSSDQVVPHYGGIYFPDITAWQKKKISFLEQIKKKDIRIIGMVSRMDRLKGVDIFVEAAALICREYPNTHFVHVGNHSKFVFDATYYQECFHRIKNLGLQENFNFIDYTDDVLSFYKYFYCTVLPTYKDTLSYVNLESMANRVPVIFTDVDGVPETTDHSDILSIPYPPSPVILSKRIVQFIKHPSVYKKLQTEVYRYILDNFDSQKNANSLLGIYRSVLSNEKIKNM